MRFMHLQKPFLDSSLPVLKQELSLDDVFIVPNYFSGNSRRDTDLSPVDGLGGSQPIVSANMNAVTGKRMAETMARCGGIGILPQDMALDTVERIVRHVRSADSRYDTALCVGLNATVRDVDGLIRKRSHNMVVVVDEYNCPLGVVTQMNLKDRDQYTPVHLIMSKNIVTVQEGISNEDAFNLMHQERLHAVPVVNASGMLLGVLTKNSAVRQDILKPSLDFEGKLMVGAAVGINSDAGNYAKFLKDIGVSVVVLDTAHGDQKKMFDAIRAVRASCGFSYPIVAGNVCTGSAVNHLVSAGANIIKVNVGPGAMCTTRMQTGVGRPTFSAVAECAEVASRYGVHVWADGGVRHPRDVALYLAAGASRVMIGSLLAATYESPGDLKTDSTGRLYKENWGMASARAVLGRNADQTPFEQAKRAFFREGISHSCLYLHEGRESVGDVIIDFITGLQSSLTYTGSLNLKDFSNNAVIGIVCPSGFIEGTPHGLKR